MARVARRGTVYGQYCPISRAVEVIGERWTLLILRDMLVGASRFNDLARGLPGISRSILSQRLRRLVDAGLVARVDGRYVLTDAGRALEPVVFGLGQWGADWMFGEPTDDELDPELLVWWMHTRVDVGPLPDRRFVLHVRFTDDRRRFWIVVDASGPSVCTSDPGFEVDVTIAAGVRTLYEVWLGRRPLRDALSSGDVALDGPTALTRRIPRILRLSPVAGMVRAAT
jgi:DNA-binding HxlR family transcriptional regulator